MLLSGYEGELAMRLFDLGAIKFGAFKLKLHETQPDAPLSPIYANLRTKDHPKNPGPLDDETMDLIGKMYERRLDLDMFDCFADIPDAGAPFGDQIEKLLARKGVSKSRLHLAKVFREDNTRYITDEIEGDYQPGDRCLLVDDLITGADTKLEAIKALEAKGLDVVAVLVVLDREQGGSTYLEQAGYPVFALLMLDILLDMFVEWADFKVRQVRQYIAENQV
jgi:uridine monophosphate synthetase